MTHLSARPTDVTISCHCARCSGAEPVVSLRKYRFICRLSSPQQEALSTN